MPLISFLLMISSNLFQHVVLEALSARVFGNLILLPHLLPIKWPTGDTTTKSNFFLNYLQDKRQETSLAQSKVVFYWPETHFVLGQLYCILLH